MEGVRLPKGGRSDSLRIAALHLMRTLFKRVSELVRPYRGRLILGILAGVLCGFMAPLLMITIKIAVSVIFPTEHDPTLFQQLEMAPGFVRGLVNRIADLLLCRLQMQEK